MKLIRSLGTLDVILLNVTAIVGLRWISLAAVGGNSSLILWLVALLLFFLPQAFAVIELTTRYPGEGGIYIWTKKAFGESHAFLAGWCYWTSNLVYFPNLLVYIAGISVFSLGAQYHELGENRLYVLIFSISALWLVMFFNIIGLKLGKWLNNLGGLSTWLTGTILILLAIISVTRYGLSQPITTDSLFQGILSFEKISFWAAMCFGFSGLELASVIAGEVKNPRRTIPRAAVISGIIIATIYILGTLSVIVSIPKSEISIISGFLQGIAAICAKLNMGWMTNMVAILITIGGIGGLMAWFTAAARMPFMAGVDDYLPAKFKEIHPRYGSPYITIIVQAAIASVFILMSFIGATVEEAYLVLLDTTLLVYFVPYVYMFLAYLVLRKRENTIEGVLVVPRNNSLAKILGISGLLTTLIAMLLSLLPASGIENVLLYELKVAGGFLMFLISGLVLFHLKKDKRAKP